MSIEIISSIEELQKYTSDELQEYAGRLYGAACEDQHTSQHSQGEQDSNGHCRTTVNYVELIRDVCIALKKRGEDFEEDLLVYLFPVAGETETASTIDKIFIKYFYCQCQGTIVSTMIALDQDDSTLAVTTISADPATRAAQLLAMELAITRFEGTH